MTNKMGRVIKAVGVDKGGPKGRKRAGTKGHDRRCKQGGRRSDKKADREVMGKGSCGKALLWWQLQAAIPVMSGRGMPRGLRAALQARSSHGQF